MGKNIGKTGMGGAGKLKEEGQIKKELWGPYREWTRHCSSVGRMSPSSPAAHTQHNLQKAGSKPLVPAWGRHSSSSKGFSKLDLVFTRVEEPHHILNHQAVGWPLYALLWGIPVAKAKQKSQQSSRREEAVAEILWEQWGMMTDNASHACFHCRSCQCNSTVSRAWCDGHGWPGQLRAGTSGRY